MLNTTIYKYLYYHSSDTRDYGHLLPGYDTSEIGNHSNIKLGSSYIIFYRFDITS